MGFGAQVWCLVYSFECGVFGADGSGLGDFKNMVWEKMEKGWI